MKFEEGIFDFFENKESEVKRAGSISAASIVTKNRQKFLRTKRQAEVEKFIYELEEGDALHLVSNGEFGSIEILFDINKKFKILKAYLTSWSLSNEFFDLYQTLGIKSADFFIDKSIISRHPQYYARLLELKNFGVATNLVYGLHAKTSIFLTEKGFFTLESSANYSRNVKIEQYCLTKSKSLYLFHKNWMDQIKCKS